MDSNLEEKIKILIVDDEKSIIEIFSYIFQSRGFYFEVGTTGKEALMRLKQNSFNIIIIDIKLPDMNGIELLKKIKKKYPELICIIITAYANVKNAINALKEGADEYFVKPLIVKKLVNKIEDMMKKKSLKKELKKANQQLTGLVESITDHICLVDKQQNIVWVNDVTNRTFGPNLIGKKCYTVFHRYQHVCESCIVEKTFTDCKIYEHETMVIDKNGNERIFWCISNVAERDLDGSPKTVIEISRDITERKKIQEKLMKAERRFRSLYENISGGILIVGSDYVIKDVNDRTCEITGFKKDELIGQPCDILCPKGSQSKKCPIWEKGQKGFKGMDTTIKCKDGTKNPILKNANKIEIDDKIYILENFQDISTQKRLEKELSEKNKLIAIGNLAGGVAHELNTPLASISLSMEYLLELFKKTDISTVKNEIIKDLKDNLTQIDLCSRILNKLYQFSKKIELKYEKISLNQILNKIITTPSISKRISNKIKIVTNFEDNININGDYEYIFEVFQNLIENSIDSFDSLTQINPKIEIILRKVEKKALIKIIDNGIGIKKKDLSRIYDPFFTTKEVKNSSGLGLSISKGIIEKHGGKMTINSKFGTGTEVIIHLPATLD
ncbi:MAG: PAS domain S-box protein [Candidatus Helarchaeota archaeon]